MPFDRSDPARELLEREFLLRREALIRYFRRNLRVRQYAEDLVQQVYLRLMGLHEPSKIKDVKAFLFWLAYRVMVDEYNREKEHQKLNRSIDLEGGENLLTAHATPGPEDDISEEQEKDALKREIALLPPKICLVFMLYHYGDHHGNRLTVPQISAQTGIPFDTVKFYIKGARKRLRERLGKSDPSQK